MRNYFPNLGKNLEALRKRRGLTQSQVGEQIGISRKTVFNWESGKTSPDSVELESAAKALGVTSREIIEKDFTQPGAEMYQLHEEPRVSGDVPTAQKCREHLNDFLDTCHKPEQIGWTYCELQDKFPLNKFKREEEP